ncbi:MAG: T9SS type A sorting domain-containing protein [Bacteroidales bacterium]|nr:T9SS type A sorting domain-containing protein [Bacteroidales bacterium]
MKKLLLSAIVFLAMFGTLKAQNTEVVIDGTVGSYETNMNRCAPIFVAVQYSISQQYYTAEEIGVEAGVMKSLSFKTDMMWYEENPRRLEVYMVNTTNSSFNGLAMEQVTTDDLVFSGNVTFTPNSWVTVELEKDFNYTGGNVLVCVNDLSSSMCYYDSYFSGFFVPATDGTRCVWNSAEEMPFDPTASAITAKETANVVPTVKFSFGEGGEPEQPGDETEDVTEVVIDGTVGSYETNMNRCAPIFVAVQYSISQQYYTADEIGVEAGVMKSLSFKTDMMWYEENPRRLEVYMVNTANSSFNGLAMEQVTTDDLVFSGNVTFSSSSWVTIELEKDFNYTGGNVLVCVNDLSSTMCYYDSYFTGFFVPTTDGTRCVWSSAEEIPFDPTTSAITAKETSNVVPSVKFAFEGDAIEEMTSTSLLVYPNPVNDRLYIEAEVEIEEVVVYDVFGRQQELSAISGQQSVVDVTSLNSGVYFVKVVTRNGEIVKRFVKK